ncbi:dehydratase [Longimycelium tulufanense]|uniref:Dehydratase n=1 Tax=Longimycelium tulufanense TaxID=907463 RepID=A0A8J3CBX2_9PSEU|nr:NAD(P)-dependent oxidoreductase [Longimycelium tulufanense]GGM71609.1 dehydratase [Longimycelium tulufanense]
MSTKKILITGATGQVARRAAEDLAKDNEVWCLARFTDPRIERELAAGDIRTWRWDMDGGTLEGLPDDFTHVMHAAAYRGDGTDFEAAVTMNSLATSRLMTHCHHAESFLFVSTGAVYARKARDHRYVETDPLGRRMGWLPTYPVSKITAEATVCAFSATLDLPATIARLNVAYGPHGHGGMPVALFRRMLAGRPIEVPHEGSDWCNPIHTDDVARQVPLLWEAAAVPARMVNWGGDEMVSIQDMMTFASEITGVPVTFLPSAVTRETDAFDNSLRRALIGNCAVSWRDGLPPTLRAHVPTVRGSGA